MNWDMLGAIGEIVGAAAVVLTLVYVARQMQTSTAADQRSRYDELTTEVSRVARGWAESDALSDIMFRGFQDPSSLKPDEVFRFYSSIYGAMTTWEAVTHYSIEKGVHVWGAEGMQATMRSFFALPGLQEYWANRRTWFSKEFQREVDKMMSEETDRMDTAYERPPSA